jgi:hypothetical protein
MSRRASIGTPRARGASPSNENETHARSRVESRRTRATAFAPSKSAAKIIVALGARICEKARHLSRQKHRLLARER